MADQWIVFLFGFGRQSGARMLCSAADKTTDLAPPSFLWPLACCHGSEMDGRDCGASCNHWGHWSSSVLNRITELIAG